MADQKITDLTEATSLLGTDLLELLKDPAGTPLDRKVQLSTLLLFIGNGMVDATGPTNADQAMAVGTMYNTDISGYSANRTFTLPATAAVGNRCGITLTAGNATYGLLITAASGDSLRGVSGGTEWSRLCVVGESVVFRCVVANTTWVVERDDRIAYSAKLNLTTDASAEAAATYVYPTSQSGVWTAANELGFSGSATLGKFTARRTGTFDIAFSARSTSTFADGKYLGVRIEQDGTTTLYQPAVYAPGVFTILNAGVLKGIPLTAGQYVRFMYATEEGSKGVRATAGLTSFAIREQLGQ